MTIFNKGDLIYNEKFDEYAIYLGTTQWVGWISVYLVSTGERSQVHDDVWERA
jgi:hypothetical protein